MNDDVKILDVETGEWVVALEGHDSLVADTAFLRDGSVVLTGGLDGTVRMWDTACGEVLASIDADVGEVLSLALSSDGRWLLAGGDGGAVALLELEKYGARRVAMLPGLSSFVLDLAIDASGALGAGVRARR